MPQKSKSNKTEVCEGHGREISLLEKLKNIGLNETIAMG